MATRGVRPSTLQKRLVRWKTVLKLGDWAIDIRYATKNELEQQKENEKDPGSLAFVPICDPAAKRAQVLIARDYHEEIDHKKSWNLDTIIIHELIHIVLWAEMSELPEKFQKHNKIKKLEELVCNSFADIVYNIFYNHL